jgi:Family of unknown function (DUF6209)
MKTLQKPAKTVSVESSPFTAKTAMLAFKSGWVDEQSGDVVRRGRVEIDYDIYRLPACLRKRHGAEIGNTEVFVRFYPRGELFHGSVAQPVREGGITISHAPLTFEIDVPSAATQMELWFHNYSFESGPCDAWDSRFGRNYWYAVQGNPPSFVDHPVSPRTNAQVRPDIVSVLEQTATKRNVFPQPPSGSRNGTDIQTLLNLRAWVSDAVFGANAWIDVHVFDAQDQRIHAETIPLKYTGFGPFGSFGLDGKIYQGSIATPGSVSPKPDARKIQYRLYYDIHYQVFCDGVLHQIELKDDAESTL